MKISKNPRTFIVTGVIMLIVGMLSLFLLPREPLDLSKEEALFPSINMPPQAV